MKKYFLKQAFQSTVILSLLASCTGQNGSQQKESVQSMQTKPASTTLKLAIWPNYISESLIKDFEKANNVKVEVSYFSANEELYAKLKAGGALYDLIVPSDYMVEVLIKESLVEELGANFKSTLENIDSPFLNKPFDKENKYSIPYAWTTTGIAYNKDLLKDPVTSWNALLSNKSLAGKLSLLDDGREVIAAALKAGGNSVNSTDAKALASAKGLLDGVRKRVKLFTSEPYLALSNKEVSVAQIYSSDALHLKREGKLNLEFVIPDEGGSFAIDNFAIPKGAQARDLAEKFVAFVLTPQNYKVNFEAQLFGPVVKNLSSIVSKELQSNAVLFPKADKVSKLEQMQDLGDKSDTFDKLWTHFKAQ